MTVPGLTTGSLIPQQAIADGLEDLFSNSIGYLYKKI
jgi:hypothetical protein